MKPESFRTARASLTLLVLASLGAACASTSPTPPPVATSAPRFAGPAARVIELPLAAGTGDPREAHMLVQEPTLKIATITLRAGTTLPEHDSAVAVTIQALEGAGTVVAHGERMRIDRGHAVVLDAKVRHAVEPDAGTDLVLLVTHHGAASANAAAPAAGHAEHPGHDEHKEHAEHPGHDERESPAGGAS